MLNENLYLFTHFTIPSFRTVYVCVFNLYHHSNRKRILCFAHFPDYLVTYHLCDIFHTNNIFNISIVEEYMRYIQNSFKVDFFALAIAMELQILRFP